MHPRVSIVVASHNRRDQLLASVPRHLELPERPRVIVVDDGSTDGTVEALEAAHPEVDCIRLERNVGAAARNVGVSAADTDYVAFSDDDSWWEPGALTAAADLLDAHPSLALIQAHIVVGPEARDDDICHEMAATPLPRDEHPGHPILSFVAAAAVVRREAFLEVGGFNERLGIGGEEELLGWDLAGAGWRLAYVPEIRGHHHPPPPAPGGRPLRRELGIRNTLWTTWLRRPAGAATRRTLRSLRRFPLDRVTARAIGRAVAGVPWVLRERQVSPPDVERMRRLLDVQQLRSTSRRYVD
jgi:N-acetylglucosaminyl-diphospho-decaprenol L-rhamnosyltransferase